MLATRIIPTLLCRGRQLVKGQQFDSWRSVGVAMQAARIHAMRGVDELCILDIGATPEGRGPDLGLVRELSEACFIPLTIGGGVRSVDDVNNLLRAGADKVAIKTAAIKDPALIRTLADRFGNQAITVAIDVPPGDDYEICASAWALTFEEQGAGEIMLTAMGREGMLTGYDLGLIGSVSGVVSIPVIAHGGCGSYDHMLQAVKAGASAVAAGAMFQFTDNTPAGAAEYLNAHGIEVRMREVA